MILLDVGQLVGRSDVGRSGIRKHTKRVRAEIKWTIVAFRRGQAMGYLYVGSETRRTSTLQIERKKKGGENKRN